MPGRPPKDDGKLPADFVSHITRLVGVHLALGHWDRAVETVRYAEKMWDERQTQDSEPIDLSASHVSCLKLDARTLNYIERACTGTIGSLLERFPHGFETISGVGVETIKTIADELVRIRAIGKKDAAARVNYFRRHKDGG